MNMIEDEEKVDDVDDKGFVVKLFDVVNVEHNGKAFRLLIGTGGANYFQVEYENHITEGMFGGIFTGEVMKVIE